MSSYGLTEHKSPQHPPRTRANVQQADETVIFGQLTGGTKLTLDTCIQEGKSYLVNPSVDALRAWLAEHQIRVLNVAGSRGSSLTLEQVTEYRGVLLDALRKNNL